MIKLFEQFKNSYLGDNIIKKFDVWTYPLEPFQRELTKEENKVMRDNFAGHSWSNFVDANSRIILGGGEEEGGMYYITEDDLLDLVNKKNHS